MLILIEGLDRTGKTTAAEEIVRYFRRGEVIHFSKPDRHPIDEYVGRIASYRSTDILVLDRGHIGEQVWPQVFGRRTELDEAGRRWIEMFYASRGAIVLHARRDVNHAYGEELFQAGEPITLRQARNADVLFDYAVDLSFLPVFPHFHGQWNSSAIVEASERAAWAKVQLDCCPRWVGNPRPDLLIVGGEGAGSMPFVPYIGTVGHYLMEELICWERCAVTNAHRFGEMEPLFYLWRTLKEPRVLALGASASAALQRAGVPADTIGTVEMFRNGPRSHLSEVIGRHM